MNETKYVVTAPKFPGATPIVVGEAGTLAQARQVARQFRGPWLTYQSVRIVNKDGSLREYAGPLR